MRIDLVEPAHPRALNLNVQRYRSSPCRGVYPGTSRSGASGEAGAIGGPTRYNTNLCDVRRTTNAPARLCCSINLSGAAIPPYAGLVAIDDLRGVRKFLELTQRFDDLAGH